MKQWKQLSNRLWKLMFFANECVSTNQHTCCQMGGSYTHLNWCVMLWISILLEPIIIILSQERIRTGDLSKSMQLCKTWNRAEFPTSTKNSNTPCVCCIEISHFVNVAKHARDQCSVFSMVQNYFALTACGLLLELHAPTQVGCSYALLLLHPCL